MAAPKTCRGQKAPPKQQLQPKQNQMASRRASQALWPKVPKGAGVSSLEPSSTSIEVRLGVGTGTAQAPTCVWTSRKGGKIFLAGLPIQQTARKFPTMALQICCFPHGPETAAYSYERSEQWTDVWPAVKNTVWNGDNVLIHCIKGRHRGAFLAVLCVERCWQVNPLRRRTSTSKHVVGQNSTRCSRTKGRASGFRRLGRRRW